MNHAVIWSRTAPALLLAFGVWAAPAGWAETLTGRINGHDCAERGTACPIDRLDPHVTLEADFVLQTADGEYYFLTNLPRDVKVRHLLEVAEVTGSLDRKYNAIIVDSFRIDGQEVWSQAQQQAEYDRMFKGR